MSSQQNRLTVSPNQRLSRLIINADDFGYSASVNQAIIQSFQLGYCTSATLMPTMLGFEEACQLAHEQGLTHAVGVHFTLTQGQPLTDDIKKSPRFCDAHGVFHLKRKKRILYLTGHEKKLLANELTAQASRCRKMGIPIARADSHNHIHEEWAIGSVVIDVCRKMGIPYLRLARNCGANHAVIKQWYRLLLNQRIKIANLADSRYFGSVDDYLYLIQNKAFIYSTDTIEIMIHPDLDENAALIDRVSRKFLAPIIMTINRVGNELVA
jgi:hypothetical protein